MSDPTQFVEIIRQWMDVFTHRSMSGWARFARATGMSMPQFGVLMQLHYKGACGVSDISGRMDITTAAASQLVDKLVQSGLLGRTEDPSDRRARQLRLSAKGEELIQKGNQERYRWVEDLAASLSAEERGKVGEALTILTRAARYLETEQPASSR